GVTGGTRGLEPAVAVPVQAAPVDGQYSVVVPALRVAFVQSTSAVALSCSTFCSARKVAVVSPLPVATPLVAYWKPVATATSPIERTNVATSTSASVNPR